MYREIPWIVHFPVDSPVPTAKHRSAWRTGSYLHLGSYWKYEISSNPGYRGKHSRVGIGGRGGWRNQCSSETLDDSRTD